MMLVVVMVMVLQGEMGDLGIHVVLMLPFNVNVSSSVTVNSITQSELSEMLTY